MWTLGIAFDPFDWQDNGPSQRCAACLLREEGSYIKGWSKSLMSLTNILGLLFSLLGDVDVQIGTVIDCLNSRRCTSHQAGK